MKKDICLNCGSEYDSVLWGAGCGCNKPNVVHQKKCNGCDNMVGYMNDDDYCGVTIYCHECLNNVRK